MQLMSSCTAYRAALMTLSKATAAFADSMQWVHVQRQLCFRVLCALPL
jgi:hypothetical protein